MAENPANTQQIYASPEDVTKGMLERVLTLGRSIKSSLAGVEVAAQETPIKTYDFRQVVERVIKATVGYRLRQMLLQNYQRANLGTHSKKKRKYKDPGKKEGWLRDMIAKVQVYPIYKASGGFRLAGIGYRMPQEGGFKDAHEAAAALAYGSVHAGGKMPLPSFDNSEGRYEEKKKYLIGRDAKQSLKKFAYGQGISRRARKAVEKNYFGIMPKRMSIHDEPRKMGARTRSVGKTSYMHGSHNVWTTQPFTYWELNAGQVQELNRIFAQELQSEMARKG